MISPDQIPRLRSGQAGFSLLQLIIVVSVILVLGTSVYIWVDPITRLEEADDSVREKDILVLAQAINDYANDHDGALPFLGVVNTTKKVICTEQSGSTLECSGDNAPCLRIAHQKFYQDYLSELPVDPDKTANTDTGYYVETDSDNNLVVGACAYNRTDAIFHTTNIKVNCPLYGGGHCWYPGSTDQQDCNTVCAAEGLRCIPGATYGPDVNSSDVLYCGLQKNISASYCDSGCNEIVSGILPPTFNDVSYCETPTRGSLSCASQSDQGETPVCPCE